MEKASEPDETQSRLTAKIGYELAYLLKDRDYDVFYDHSPFGEHSGRIVSHFEDGNERGTQLSYLDIAIVEKNSQKAAVLLEIEESTDRPKTLIGDVFALLMGEKVTFKGKEIKVWEGTILIVIVFSDVRRDQLHDYIHGKVEKARIQLGTNNSRIKKVMIKTVLNLMELFEWLPPVLDKAFKGEL